MAKMGGHVDMVGSRGYCGSCECDGRSRGYGGVTWILWVL